MLKKLIIALSGCVTILACLVGIFIFLVFPIASQGNIPTHTPTLFGYVTPTETVPPTPTPRILTATPTLSIPITTTTPTPIENPSSYEVQPGDILSDISQRFGIPLGYLADQNDLDNPDLIFAGQVLTIPNWPPETDGREIYVVLSEQKVYAIEDGLTIKEFVVSTGTDKYPTVTGRYEIYVKYRYDDMEGPGYNLKDVPYVMYFFQGYGLHGTYWHNNFGVPMSHGCVNLTIAEAEWLFEWASVGTPVIVLE